MKFDFPPPPDSSRELKEALVKGIDSYVRTGRTISEEKANAIVAAVEGLLSASEPAARIKAKPRSKPARTRNKLARWTAEDYQCLRSLDWEALDAVWDRLKDDSVEEDAQLKAEERRLILSAYGKVPGDRRAERSARANVIGRLKHLVTAYELAEAAGWKP